MLDYVRIPSDQKDITTDNELTPRQGHTLLYIITIRDKQHQRSMGMIHEYIGVDDQIQYVQWVIIDPYIILSGYNINTSSAATLRYYILLPN